MDLFKELNRLTEPPPKASKVRELSREEIEELVDQGKITPIGQLPAERKRGRVHVPAVRKGFYDSRYWK